MSESLPGIAPSGGRGFMNRRMDRVAHNAGNTRARQGNSPQPLHRAPRDMHREGRAMHCDLPENPPVLGKGKVPRNGKRSAR